METTRKKGMVFEMEPETTETEVDMVLAIAHVAHEANRAWCEANGDFSQPRWEDIPDWQLDSVINGVHYHLRNPDSTPKTSHDNWLAHKAADGWGYGEVKDPEAKTHPCMVPYEDLPYEQQVKDSLFHSIVRSFL